MNRTYDVFERFSDGTVRWRATVVGHEEAMLKLQEFAESGPNEFRLMHLATQTLIASVNAPAENNS